MHLIQQSPKGWKAKLLIQVTDSHWILQHYPVTHIFVFICKNLFSLIYTVPACKEEMHLQDLGKNIKIKIRTGFEMVIHFPLMVKGFGLLSLRLFFLEIEKAYLR